MNAPVRLAERPPDLAQRIIARVGQRDATIADDLNFLTAWEAGLVPWWSGTLGMRQLSRANPVATRLGALGRPTVPP